MTLYLNLQQLERSGQAKRCDFEECMFTPTVSVANSRDVVVRRCEDVTHKENESGSA